MVSPIYAFWCRVPSLPNFGDALTPWLIKRITGRYPEFLCPNDRRHKYFVTGSVMEYTDAACTVWGSGIMRLNDPISPESKLLAVRGPLTRDRAIACGAMCPKIYGDPALLLPRFYQPSADGRRGIGLVAHFSDKPHLANRLRSIPGLKLIDIQAPVEAVIDLIASCEFVISSSLHGLIASHAYGIPALWVQFRRLPAGDNSKFYDYFLSLGLEPRPPIAVAYDQIDVAALSRRIATPTLRIDLDLLFKACPFGVQDEH